jgi:thiosulfate/3-mercaptopyruvate sulfurtransferase
MTIDGNAGDSVMTSPADDPLVTTDWLAARLDDPKVKIIDASYKMPGVLPLPSDDYLAAHIPGAVFFNVNTIADSDDPRPLCIRTPPVSRTT